MARPALWRVKTHHRHGGSYSGNLNGDYSSRGFHLFCMNTAAASGARKGEISIPVALRVPTALLAQLAETSILQRR
ncbi:hypothetical protein VULLAG_LOCUS20144 [Vulpes lagopus]